MFAVTEPLSKQVEQSYLDDIRHGDATAYELVFRKYYGDMCRYAFSIIQKQDESEDIVQQVFVNFWENREKTIITGSVKGYLFRSVHNHCLNSIKHQRVKAGYLQYSSFFESQYQLGVEEGVQGKELSERIEKAIASLPVECGRIFRMNRLEEMKYKEIADELKLSVKTVENQIGKALKLLRVSLADYLVCIILILLGK
jgi:RNA polymerase sigma-70 factor (ECF subfamily)